EGASGDAATICAPGEEARWAGARGGVVAADTLGSSPVSCVATVATCHCARTAAAVPRTCRTARRVDGSDRPSCAVLLSSSAWHRTCARRLTRPTADGNQRADGERRLATANVSPERPPTEPCDSSSQPRHSGRKLRLHSLRYRWRRRDSNS